MNLRLLRSNRSLLALFITQFSGAFNDNFYKSALLMLFTYGGFETLGLGVNVMNNLIAVTLIIPFIILAPLVGQYGDKYDRAKMIQRLKIAEMVFMLIGVWGVWMDLPLVMLLVLLLTGIQSACFSPLKYSSIPSMAAADQLVAANGLIHAGTSMAVFSGLIIGSLMMALPMAKYLLVWVALLVAIIGWFASRSIAPLPVADSEIVIRMNPLKQLRRVFAYARADKFIFWVIIALSWYWFMGSIYLAQIPNLAKTQLQGEPLVVTLIMTLFLLGTFLSALISGRFTESPHRTSLILVGGVGVSLFGVDLFFSCQAFSAVTGVMQQPLSLIQWVNSPGALRILLDVMMIGTAGGIYMVPLFSLLQGRSNPRRRAQILSANTVVNAAFMVLAAVVGVVSLGWWKMSIIDMLLMISVVHLPIILTLLRGHSRLWQLSVRGDKDAKTRA